jgi:hypothetical protein
MGRAAGETPRRPNASCEVWGQPSDTVAKLSNDTGLGV